MAKHFLGMGWMRHKKEKCGTLLTVLADCATIKYARNEGGLCG